MKKCPKCNEIISDSARFCPTCGRRFDSNETAFSNEDIITQKTQYTYPSIQLGTSNTQARKITNNDDSVNNVTKSKIPSYQFWLIVPSAFLNWLIFVPIIGIIFSYIAYSKIDEIKSECVDVGSMKGWTIFAIIVHLIFLIAGAIGNYN
ncbi:MAG: zinc-ribbon domain-containing protein [Candidatus Izemoplasmatales bacterium]